jgi:UDP-N-acetylmuramyl pentapeptide phosphotransferase/UDP-N-acetylglucosamine-1-phosphate transferase
VDRSAVVAFGLTAVLAPLLLRALRRSQVLDRPTERSSHSEPVPRGLGLAVAAGLVGGVATATGLGDVPLNALLLTTGAYGLLGLIDDVRGLPVIPRLGLQVTIAICGLPFILRDLTGPGPWRILVVVASVVWLVGFVNSFNFMDGINGISVAQTIVAGAAFVIIGQADGVRSLTVLGAIAVGAALGIAPLNYPRARGFLGDVGSYLLGAWFAVLVILALRAGVPVEAAVGALSIYLADTATTLVRRVRMGEQWWTPHRSHVYQRLTLAGWSHELTTAFVAAAMLLCGLLGTLSMVGSNLVRVPADVLLAVTVVVYVTTPRRVSHHRRRAVPVTV